MNDDTRERLLDAVEHLMRTRGLARISTRAIAQRAGLAEGTLYNHFNDKIDLFIAVIQRNVAELSEVLHSLPLRVGQVRSGTTSRWWRRRPLPFISV